MIKRRRMLNVPAVIPQYQPTLNITKWTWAHPTMIIYSKYHNFITVHSLFFS
jgi:hypothetical protein